MIQQIIHSKWTKLRRHRSISIYPDRQNAHFRVVVAKLALDVMEFAANFGAEERIPGVDGEVPSGGVGHSAAATAVVLLGAGAVATDAQHASPADEVAPRHWKYCQESK